MKKRLYHCRGSPFEIGIAMGRALGRRLEANIDRYIQERLLPEAQLDRERWQTGSLPWLESLPSRFLEEFKGLSQGSGLPLQRLAEWVFLEVLLDSQCSGVICLLDGHAWVARNNDTFAPDMWGYATIREVSGRIPAISFCLEGDVFTPSGVNHEQLWLHYNYLPATDAPDPAKPHLPAYAFVVEALETCRSLQDVEGLLASLQREGGMLLFAVDGKAEQFALYECNCTSARKLHASDSWLVGTNHRQSHSPGFPSADLDSLNTYRRYERLEQLVHELYQQELAQPVHTSLIQILADDGVEKRRGDIQTAYSNVACPGRKEIWYTFGGCPSASHGDWQRLEWPW